MKTKGIPLGCKQLLFLFIYYCFAQFLPDSYCFISPVGKVSNSIRIWCVKHIFKKCGRIRTINRRVQFGSGRNIEMGDESGIGARTSIPSNTIIGKHVILSRDCMLWHANHNYDRTDIPINDQGMGPTLPTIIEDDCWIGMRCLLTPGRHVRKGTLVAMGSVLTKDYPEYSVVGGAPAKLIRNRLESKQKQNEV